MQHLQKRRSQGCTFHTGPFFLGMQALQKSVNETRTHSSTWSEEEEGVKHDQSANRLHGWWNTKLVGSLLATKDAGQVSANVFAAKNLHVSQVHMHNSADTRIGACS